MKSFYNFKPLLLPILFFSFITTKAAGVPLILKTDSGTVAKSNKKAVQKNADADTSWKPIRRVWGYAFGDLYYDGHSDAGGRGGETNYSGVPTYRNAFQFRRLYLGYDYDISKKFTATLLLASEPTASTSTAAGTSISNGDNLVDNRMSFYIKYANIRVHDLWPGTDITIGEQATPTWNLSSEQIFNHRWIERTIVDFHKLGNSFDVGAGLEGNFDPETKNFGYNLLVGNNTQSSLLSASNPATGFYKEFYGDIYGRFLDKRIYVDFYADYARTAAATAAVGGQAHNMFKGIISYSVPVLTLGVEAFTDNITNGVTLTNGSVKTPANATATGVSLNAYGSIIKDKLGFIARFDTYNPDTEFVTGTTTYSVNTNLGSYSPYTKENFYVAGIDYTPAPNIHFSPNVWFLQFKDQQTPTATGYVSDDHTIIYRLTFFFTFGK
ncbi:MAG TPA: hypothetical protein VFE53_19545 [Mucilaginibacter sp.]|jgi:hypothetical protein|nr:hypothetical protein [Mucilaginibacter sp.]